MRAPATFLLLALLSMNPAAADSDTARWITLDEALAQAAVSNPDLRAAREALAKADYELKAQRAAYWPSLSGSAAYSRSDSDRDTDGATDRTSAGLSASYTLFSGFADQSRVAQAEQAMKKAEADWAQAQADASAAVRTAFLQLLYEQERTALARTIAERRKQNLNLVELRYESGSEHKGSLLRTQAGTRQSEFDLEQAQRGIAVQQRELSNVIGAFARVAWVARGEWRSEEPESDPAWLDLARATPRWRAAEATLEGLRLAVTVARSDLYPELALRAGIDRSGESWPPDNESWSVGATLSVPLFTGGRNINQLAAAQAAFRQAQAEFQKTCRQIQFDLESRWTNLRDARARREVQVAFLEAAKVRAEIAREQYANGLLSFQNWDQIEDELIQRQQALLAGERDAARASAEWDRARGRSLLNLP